MYPVGFAQLIKTLATGSKIRHVGLTGPMRFMTVMCPSPPQLTPVSRSHGRDFLKGYTWHSVHESLTRFIWVSPGAQAETRIQGQVVYLTGEASPSSQVGKWAKKVCIIKILATVGPWSLISVESSGSQGRTHTRVAPTQGRGSYTPTPISCW